MQVNYCDLCDTAIKNDQGYILIAAPKVSEPMTANEFIFLLQNHTKEICPICKTVLDEIFKLRFNNLKTLSNELLAIYNLQIQDTNKNELKKKKVP
jgi:hypothetical protein